MTRLLAILSATGEVVRGHNAGHWRISRPMWTSMTSWLGEAMTPTDPDAGYAEIVRRLLWTFGPATEDDLVWWLGATKGAVRAALAGVDGDRGRTRRRLDRRGCSPTTPPTSRSPPTPSRGWRCCRRSIRRRWGGAGGRDFHLDPAHTPFLFDRAGNGGIDGVGRRPDRRVLGAGRARAGPADPPGGGVDRTPGGCSTSRSPASTSSSAASTSPTCSPPPR